MTSPRDGAPSDDLTDDLTVDGADLLAEIQAEQLARQAVGGGPGPEDLTDDLTVDGADLLAEIQAAMAAETDQSAIDHDQIGEDTERTQARWRPTPTIPPPEVVASSRSGRPTVAHLIVIAAVIVVTVVAAAWVLVTAYGGGDDQETPLDIPTTATTVPEGAGAGG